MASTSLVSSIRLSSSSFLFNFCAISSSVKREMRFLKRSRRSGGPSPNKPNQESLLFSFKKLIKDSAFLHYLQIGSPNCRKLTFTSTSSVET